MYTVHIFLFIFYFMHLFNFFDNIAQQNYAHIPWDILCIFVWQIPKRVLLHKIYTSRTLIHLRPQVAVKISSTGRTKRTLVFPVMRAYAARFPWIYGAFPACTSQRPVSLQSTFETLSDLLEEVKLKIYSTGVHHIGEITRELVSTQMAKFGLTMMNFVCSYLF